MTAPTSTMMTITIAREIIPVVSPETGTGVGTGVGVSSVSFSTWWLALAANVAEAARALSKACKTPARNVMAIRKIPKIMRALGMWTGFMFLPSITETYPRVPAGIGQKHLFSF